MITLFEQAGGEFAVRLIIHDFVGRAFADTMIGYLFRNADIGRVREMEYQFAAAHLGAPVRYLGQPLTSAHRRHQISDGQFARRLRLLEQVLRDHECPTQVIEHWLVHTQSLRSKVVSDEQSCGVEESEHHSP